MGSAILGAAFQLMQRLDRNAATGHVNEQIAYAGSGAIHKGFSAFASWPLPEKPFTLGSFQPRVLRQPGNLPK